MGEGLDGMRWEGTGEGGGKGEEGRYSGLSGSVKWMVVGRITWSVSSVKEVNKIL